MVDQTKIKFFEFDWDKGNVDKNLIKHKVTNEETEEIFFNEPLTIFEDLQHSSKEERFVAYGRTDEGRKLTIIFIIRKNKIRVISARDQSGKEKTIYEKV